MSAAPIGTGFPVERYPSQELLFSCGGVSVVLPHALGDRKILDDITFEVRRGEVFTIVGTSGTGKTTLIRVLGGLTPATTGSVRINGRLLSGPPEEVVIVFQDYSHALLQWRTVARNVAFGLEGRLPQAEIEERVRGALRLVRLDKNADDYFDSYFGGGDDDAGDSAPESKMGGESALGAAPSFCTVYEDTDLGLEAARRAGMIGVDVRPIIRAAVAL